MRPAPRALKVKKGQPAQPDLKAEAAEAAAQPARPAPRAKKAKKAKPARPDLKAEAAAGGGATGPPRA